MPQLKKKDMNSAHTQVKQIWLTDADFLLAELQCAFISKGLHFKCSSCQQNPMEAWPYNSGGESLWNWSPGIFWLQKLAQIMPTHKGG